MFSKIKNLVTRRASEIGRDPARASRAAFAGILICGMFSLFLNFENLAPQFFRADVLDPLTSADLTEAAETKNAFDEKLLANAKTCAANVEANEGDNFLADFEASLAGVLPGAGNLLLANPAVVSERKEQLVAEVLKKYSHLKFCIPEENFETLYRQNYATIYQYFGPYFQVKIREKNSSDSGFTKMLSDSNGAFTDAFALAEKDIWKTQNHVREIIDNAIESAIALDEQTQIRIANLTSQTRNQLLADIGARQNTQIEIGNSGSDLLEEIRDMTATENFYGGTTGPETNKSSFPGSTLESASLANKVASLAEAAGKLKISYGLLNLVDDAARTDYSKNRFASETALYYAAFYLIDPLAPGAGNLASTALQNKIPAFDSTSAKKQSCLLDAKCFASAAGESTFQNSRGPATGTPTPTTSASTTGSGGKTNFNSSAPMIPVNIEQVGGVNVSNPLPVKTQQ